MGLWEHPSPPHTHILAQVCTVYKSRFLGRRFLSLRLVVIIQTRLHIRIIWEFFWGWGWGRETKFPDSIPDQSNQNQGTEFFF